MAEQSGLEPGPVYDYIVLTAAITRPDLHARLVPGYLEFVRAARVKWLINVDDVHTSHSTAATVANLEKLLAPAANVDLEVLEPRDRSCFFTAATRLAGRAHELLGDCRTGVVWLEDDWEYARKHPAAGALSTLRLRLARNRTGDRILRCRGTLDRKQPTLDEHERKRNARWFVSLVPRSRVSFNPGIWSKTMFEQGFWKRLAEYPPGRIDDPETVCADPFNEESAYRQLSIFVDPVFQDAGRRWSAQRGLAKWRKDRAALEQQGSVTYERGASDQAVVHAGAERPSGFFRCPDLLRGTPLSVLGRIRRAGDGMEARLVAVPFLSFDLTFVDRWRADVHLNRLQPWARTYPYKGTPVRMTWNPGNDGQAGTVTFATSMRTVTAPLETTLPLRWAWMIPIQGVAGVLAYVVNAIRTATRLDSE